MLFIAFEDDRIAVEMKISPRGCFSHIYWDYYRGVIVFHHAGKRNSISLPMNET